MKRRTLILLLAAMVLPVLSGQVPAGFDPEQAARLSSRMEAFVQQGTIAGAVTLLQRRGGDPLLKAYGLQEIESKKPMRPDSIFQIMSMTKPVTALGVMLLLEEGRLSLNDPVERHLPEFRDYGLSPKETTAHESSSVLRGPSLFVICSPTRRV